MKYKFTEQRKMDELPGGKVRCYYNEDIQEETVTVVDKETGEERTETYPVYIYDAVDIIGPAEKGVLVDALIRVRYSQADVEAIMRHKIANVSGATAEFREFNDYAEAMKVEANRILS
jgi:hypothetical protein